MKKIILSTMFASVALAAFALDRSELDQRIHSLMFKFESMQMQPQKQVPADVLGRAKGIILLDRTKGGLVFGYENGFGVALARDLKTGQWSPPAFLKANQFSFGAQIGGSQNFYVILLMTTNAPQVLTDPHFDFGGEARGTAGNSSAGTGSSISDLERPVLVYDDRSGLYGGATLKTDSIAPDEEANRVYYGDALAMKDILYDGKVLATPIANDLINKINGYSQQPTAQK
jgi:SH3 domain-containing YSC84-like protein 1